MATELDRVYARIDSMARDQHATALQVAVLQTEVKNQREQSANQHADLAARIDNLAEALSDQGKTPAPAPRALPTLAPEEPRREESRREQLQDEPSLVITPSRAAYWLRVVIPLLGALGLGGLGTRALEAVSWWAATETHQVEQPAPPAPVDP